MEQTKLKEIRGIKSRLQHGDLKRIQRITAARGMNKGVGYSYIYVKHIFEELRYNQEVIDVAKEVVQSHEQMLTK